MTNMTLEEKVDELRQDMQGVKQALRGYNGNQGLIPAFEKHCEADTAFHEEYYKFKRNVLTVFAFLTGTGALSVSIWKLFF